MLFPALRVTGEFQSTDRQVSVALFFDRGLQQCGQRGLMPGKDKAMPKQQTFTSSVSFQKGDVIVNPADKNGGFHVVLRDHVSGLTAPKPGESNDFYHYSLGASSAGKM